MKSLLREIFAITLILVAVGFATIGCSSGPTIPPLTPVSGVVTKDGKGLAGANLMFIPTAAEGNGGLATTDETGAYSATYIRGGEGLPPGEYRVVISHRLMPDGSPEPAGVEPMDSPAKEMLPPKYSSEALSKLKTLVGAEAAPVNFELK